MKHVLINNLKQNITFYIDMKDIFYKHLIFPDFASFISTLAASDETV